MNENGPLPTFEHWLTRPRSERTAAMRQYRPHTKQKMGRDIKGAVELGLTAASHLPIYGMFIEIVEDTPTNRKKYPDPLKRKWMTKPEEAWAGRKRSNTIEGIEEDIQQCDVIVYGGHADDEVRTSVIFADGWETKAINAINDWLRLTVGTDHRIEILEGPQ